MWVILKVNKKKISLLERDFKNILGSAIVFYNPKILVEKFKKKKIIRTHQDVLNDYILCYHSNFCEKNSLLKLKYSRGLKYFLSGFESHQKDLVEFVKKFKSLEDENGLITKSLFDLSINENYRFNSGPFVNKIFKIIKIEKNKIKTLMGNIKTTISKNKYIYSH
tara:strand:- start:11034 stop:11528 length:495 start_codon:yes stop_codon:yes gene_type:complete